METYGIILAGGGGERFWPLSRKETPKQLLNLSGREIMVNETIDRLSLVCNRENIYIVTSAQQAQSMESVTASRLEGNHILPEPTARNTAACIGYAAIRIQKQFGDGIMVITPSDAYIKDNERFAGVLGRAIEAAETTGHLVTVGITPTFPATGYGYICFKNSETSAKKVVRFVEKPDYKHAKRYYSSENYVWNSGMFIFKASAILQAYKKHVPDIYKLLVRIGKDLDTPNEKQTLEELYPQIRSISIDYAVMEKSKKILVVPGEFGWSDVGSWDMLSAIYNKDENGNIIVSDYVGYDTKDCVIYSKNRLISAVGLRDLVIVETPDAILVCDKHRAQDVKKIVEELRRRGREELL